VFPYQIDSSRANSAPSPTQARKPARLDLILAGRIPYSYDFRRIRIYKPFRPTGADTVGSGAFGKVSGKGINRTAKSSPETIVGKLAILKRSPNSELWLGKTWPEAGLKPLYAEVSESWHNSCEKG